MAVAEWADIRIVGADESKTHNPDPQRALFHVYLELSASPPYEWAKLFEGERQFPRHSMWRRAWIEGRYIVVHCALDEIRRYHLADLKQDVENSNQKYRQVLVEQERQRAAEDQRQREERKRVEEALGDLDLP